MRISLEHPNQPEVTDLIAELDAFHLTLYALDSSYLDDINASIRQPNVLFAVVRTDDGDAIGCGAMVVNQTVGELKRMYLRPTWRGRGIAKLLLAFLEKEAADKGCVRFMLETGSRQPEAIGLYERSGYVRCEVLEHGAEDSFSVLMEKSLEK